MCLYAPQIRSLRVLTDLQHEASCGSFYLWYDVSMGRLADVGYLRFYVFRIGVFSQYLNVLLGILLVNGSEFDFLLTRGHIRKGCVCE